MQAETLRENLHCIRVPSPTLPPATTTNCWILGDHQGLIVDPAAHKPDTQYELLAHLQDFSPKGIFLTHHHHDHIGAAQMLSDALSIPIFAHHRTADLVPFSCTEWHPDQVFELANETWHTIHTPGHAPGHLCLLSSLDRSMIAGDMVAGEGTILINPAEGSIKEYLESLYAMELLAPSRLLPAHGNVLDGGVQTLQAYQRHRRQRLEQIAALLTQTPQSTREIARQIYSELPPQFLGMAAIQVECGLIYLEDSREAVMTLCEGQQRWIQSNETSGAN